MCKSIKRALAVCRCCPSNTIVRFGSKPDIRVAKS
jgi:hypothetical protein